MNVPDTQVHSDTHSYEGWKGCCMSLRGCCTCGPVTPSVFVREWLRVPFCACPRVTVSVHMCVRPHASPRQRTPKVSGGHLPDDRDDEPPKA
eukprot:50516-Eustigmatos_ZCMA.PRE.1